MQAKELRKEVADRQPRAVREGDADPRKPWVPLSLWRAYAGRRGRASQGSPRSRVHEAVAQALLGGLLAPACACNGVAAPPTVCVDTSLGELLL